MPNAQPAETLKCMNCGAPIKSGFFCARCQSGEEPSTGKGEAWKGSRFTGDAKKKRQQQMLKEDLTTWGKRLLILVILCGVGFGGYVMFGDRIQAAFHQAQSVTQPREKYDPTKDASTTEDDQGQANGKRAFSGNGGKL